MEATIASAATAQGSTRQFPRCGPTGEAAGITSSFFFRQLDPRVGDVVQPLFRVLPQAAPEKAADTRRNARGKGGEVGRRLQDRRQEVGDGLPSKSRRPVSISKRTTPKDQMSARLSTALPRACSGDM